MTTSWKKTFLAQISMTSVIGGTDVTFWQVQKQDVPVHL
jgi:hypothetical protein